MKMEEIKKHLEEEDKKREEKPWIIKTLLNIGDFLWYKCILRIEDLPTEIKWFYQRTVHGYDESDTWSLDRFIVKKIYKPLKVFIKNYEEGGLSLPIEYATDPAAWLLILKKIEYSFDDLWDKDNDPDYDKFKTTPEKLKEHEERVEEGLELFGRHIRDLWD